MTLPLPASQAGALGPAKAADNSRRVRRKESQDLVTPRSYKHYVEGSIGTTSGTTPMEVGTVVPGFWFQPGEICQMMVWCDIQSSAATTTARLQMFSDQLWTPPSYPIWTGTAPTERTTANSRPWSNGVLYSTGAGSFMGEPLTFNYQYGSGTIYAPTLIQPYFTMVRTGGAGNITVWNFRMHVLIY
jgi:hypothetical protein